MKDSTTAEEELVVRLKDDTERGTTATTTGIAGGDGPDILGSVRYKKDGVMRPRLCREQRGSG